MEEEIFQKMVMMMTIPKRTTTKVMDLMVINMLNCGQRIMHAKCLTTLGRIKPECLYCEDIKVKPERRGGGGE
eukprot:3094227-Amphidinium_carterae.1